MFRIGQSDDPCFVDSLTSSTPPGLENIIRAIRLGEYGI